jgi:hypothetical protein
MVEFACGKLSSRLVFRSTECVLSLAPLQWSRVVCLSDWSPFSSARRLVPTLPVSILSACFAAAMRCSQIQALNTNLKRIGSHKLSVFGGFLSCGCKLLFLQRFDWSKFCLVARILVAMCMVCASWFCGCVSAVSEMSQSRLQSGFFKGFRVSGGIQYNMTLLLGVDERSATNSLSTSGIPPLLPSKMCSTVLKSGTRPGGILPEVSPSLWFIDDTAQDMRIHKRPARDPEVLVVDI